MSLEAIVRLIASTRTKTAYAFDVDLTEAVTPKANGITDIQMENTRIDGRRFHDDWNYDINPWDQIAHLFPYTS